MFGWYISIATDDDIYANFHDFHFNSQIFMSHYFVEMIH